ncbi:hypothetical protein HELRODRAFT_189664, partial [Helobdella robusta]|uniref:CNH domain-containing protein n=1 Tax=Helobdella robusta TaxID=6412 RepID=T1FR86_HELRO
MEETTQFSSQSSTSGHIRQMALEEVVNKLTYFYEDVIDTIGEGSSYANDTIGIGSRFCIYSWFMFVLCRLLERLSSYCLSPSQILYSESDYYYYSRKYTKRRKTDPRVPTTATATTTATIKKGKTESKVVGAGEALLAGGLTRSGNITCCAATPSSVGGSLWSSGESEVPHFHPEHPCWCSNHQNIPTAPSIQLAMHDAYSLNPVVEKLPKCIESVACYRNNLLLGTREGYLLLYTIRNHNNRIESILEKSNKNFSKKPITQLEVIPEYHILLSLSDNVVSVHDLTVFKLISVIEKTRGANCFNIDLKKEVLQNGESEYSLKLCVSVKRRLQFYYWKNRQFHDLRPELNLPDVPKCLVWCVDTIFLGYKKDYVLVSLVNETSKELFSTGKQMEPSIMNLTSNKISLLKDESTIFVDTEGNATQKSVITWNSTPLQLLYDHPYMIAISATSVEVRTIDPRCFIQSLEINKARIICSAKSHGRQQQ